MTKTVLLVIVLSIFLGLSASSASNIIYVDVNGPNEPGTGTLDDPFRLIQDAIDSATADDVVEIQPGIYTGQGNYELDPNGKSITIRSVEPNDPNIVAATVVDPCQAGRGFHFDSGEDANCLVLGLTITDGYTMDEGGGVYCNNSSPTISNCVISNNSAQLYGAGIYCANSLAEIKACTITGNSAQDGGGVECRSDAGPNFTNCIMSDNRATDAGGGGGGLDAVACNNISLNNCTFTGNSTDGYGGAVRCEESQITIKNSILWANSAVAGSQIALDFFLSNPSTVTVNSCDIQGGQQAIYVEPDAVLNWQSGNIAAEACFATFDANGDPNLWDLHLQSLYGRWEPNSQTWVNDSNMSLCIDAGDPNSDFTDEPWPNGKRVNMGAYGDTKQASMNGNPADFDVNWLVDFEDYAEFSRQWRAEESCFEDLTNNGIVDFADLDVFAENWLWQGP